MSSPPATSAGETKLEGLYNLLQLQQPFLVHCMQLGASTAQCVPELVEQKAWRHFVAVANFPLWALLDEDRNTSPQCGSETQSQPDVCSVLKHGGDMQLRRPLLQAHDCDGPQVQLGIKVDTHR